MKKILPTTLLLAFGFMIGVITTCYLSKSASLPFLDMVRLNYQTEQYIMAVRAKKLGNTRQAVMHYANLVAASSSPGLYCFSKEREYWSTTFPFSSLVLARTSSISSVKGRQRAEAINRGMLADALEKSGRTEEAMSEYIKATHLLGVGDDIASVKKVIEKVTSSDDELLELEDKYTFLKKE